MYNAGIQTKLYAIEEAHTTPSIPTFFARKNFNAIADNAAAVVNMVKVRIICTLDINAEIGAKKLHINAQIANPTAREIVGIISGPTQNRTNVKDPKPIIQAVKIPIREHASNVL
tara:strand:+ start:279 stop:623 length:345 start_codon:yes stop_codon:yes gene_type:complete